MFRICIAILCMVALTFAEDPIYYHLDDFLKSSGRIPNKCVDKGATYKCVGYEDVSGMIFNTKTKRVYLYAQGTSQELYAEYQCDEFYVEVSPNQDETITCEEATLRYEVQCIEGLVSNFSKIYEYDELEILVDKKELSGNENLCRNAFHYQYGNDSGKQYDGINATKSSKAPDQKSGSYDIMKNPKFSEEIEKVLQDVAGLQTTGKTVLGSQRKEVNDSDGFTGLLGGGGGGIATKAKGSIKTPSESDVKMGKGGGSRLASDIMKVVRQRTPGLRHIYNKHLKKNPGFQGKVVLKMTIAPGGEIISISIASSTTGYEDFDEEIMTAVSRWKFSKVKDGNTTVTIPFTFSE